jgi:hypothetical protein
MPSQGLVFVAIPFGGIHDEVYNRAIAPAIAGAGYRAYRADASAINRDILNDRIIRPMQISELGLFDVSTNNPNVLWELGFARCMNLPALVTSFADVKDAPFDIRSSTILRYSPVGTGIDDFRSELSTHITAWRTLLPRSDDGLHVRCHGTKFDVPGASDFWRHLHEEAEVRLILLGRTNKSWLTKEDDETIALAQSITRVAEHPGGSVTIISNNDPDVIQYHVEFLRARLSLTPTAQGRVEYYSSSTANYGAHATDKRLVLLPYAHSEDFRDLSLVLEIMNPNSRPYKEYISDIHRYYKDRRICQKNWVW